VNVVEACGQWKGEVRARENILGIASVYRVSSKRWPVTQIFHSVTAVPAISVDAAHPGDPDPRSQRQLRGRAFDYLSYDLVAGNEPWLNRRQISLNNVQVGTTDPAGNYPKQHISGLELGARDVHDLQEGSGRCLRSGKDSGSHFN